MRLQAPPAGLILPLQPLPVQRFEFHVWNLTGKKVRLTHIQRMLLRSEPVTTFPVRVVMHKAHSTNSFLSLALDLVKNVLIWSFVERPLDPVSEPRANTGHGTVTETHSLWHRETSINEAVVF